MHGLQGVGKYNFSLKLELVPLIRHKSGVATKEATEAAVNCISDTSADRIGRDTLIEQSLSC